MKRTTLLLGVVLAAFILLSQTGTEAHKPTLTERFASGQTTGTSGVYNFDKNHTAIGFKVRHNGLIDIPGYFRDFTGSINYDAKEVSKSSVEFTAKVTSVDTGVKGRDDHLRRADFFEVEKFPDLTFKSTKVEKSGNSWMVTGDLTMKGVTKSITIPFNIAGFKPATERSSPIMGITAATKLNRRDYGINYGNAATISDEISIDLQIEAPMPRPAAPASPAAAAPKTE